MLSTLNSKTIYDYRYLLAFTSLGIVYFLNMFIDVMDVDAAQYASISREMLETGSYLEVYHRGLDYLDKPPMLFWLSSFSMKLFGLSNFAYKLPAILVIILGVYSTYRFALMWYDRQRAIYAALILASTQALFLVTNDVRTDGMLTGFVIFSIWQLSRFLRDANFKYLIYGSIGVAAAMMTKGPIGIVIVGLALGGDLLLKRDWKAIFKWEWIVFLLIVGLLLIPMCYGLYTQFDLHPEKEVYGLSGPSGVKFFFWTQSFGRITGDIYWKDDSSYFFFFHTILWDFQPWIFFLIPALFLRFKELIVQKFNVPANKELMTFFGFILSFLALSSSSFKLPHYIFPLFPFAAIITADFIASLIDTKVARRFARFQFGFLHLFFAISFASFFVIFETDSIVLPLVLIILFVLFWMTYKKVSTISDKIILPTIISMFAFGLLMSLHFYPNLLLYQSESLVGKELQKRGTPIDMFYTYETYGHSLDFYSRRINKGINVSELANYKKGTLIFTTESEMEKLTGIDGPGYRIDTEYNDYNITGLSFDFLLKEQRDAAIEKKYLLVKE